MDIIHGVFVYVLVINVCVVARGGHGGGGHGGSHGGSHGGAHGGSHGYGHSSYGSHGHVTASHHHYSYHPPQHVHYTCRTCSSTQLYPVYHSMPPTYVYTYKDSGSRYSDVLVGLSLYNLGRTSGMSSSHAHANQYHAHPDERCSLQIIDRSHFEETEFPCFMISSFIEPTTTDYSRPVDITSSNNDVKPFLKDTGPALQVTDEQTCVLWHNMTMHKEQNHVPCALLKEYAASVRQSGVPPYIWMPTLLGTILAIYLCCFCCCKKKEKESVKEEAPLNELRVPGYCSNY